MQCFFFCREPPVLCRKMSQNAEEQKRIHEWARLRKYVRTHTFSMQPFDWLRILGNSTTSGRTWNTRLWKMFLSAKLRNTWYMYVCGFSLNGVWRCPTLKLFAALINRLLFLIYLSTYRLAGSYGTHFKYSISSISTYIDSNQNQKRT